MPFYVTVHGGAGYHSVEDEKVVRQALRRACAKAVQLLQDARSACDTVEYSIAELEDSECLNAGYGANLTQKGTVECDAAIMDDSGKYGSVGAVSGVKNPIRVARAILDYSCYRDPLGRIPPLTLVSTGAYDFASTSKMDLVPPDTLISPRAQKEWKYWDDKAKGDTSNGVRLPKLGSNDSLMQDTVGSIALDMSGNLAAGVSSGGLLLKLPGRVGEAAVYGAGCWAHHMDVNQGVASSVSGTGEAIIRTSLARTLSEALYLDDPHEELRRRLAGNLPPPHDQALSAGAVLLSKETRADGSVVPRLWCAFNTASMAIAYASSENPQPKSMILRQPESAMSQSGHLKPVYVTVLPWTMD